MAGARKTKAMADIIVQVTDAAWEDDSEDPQSMVRRVAGALQSHLGIPLEAREVSVRFANDADVSSLNKQFRGRDGATNVLSFPATPVPGQAGNALGDIILARETVLAEAAAQGKTITDHACHLVLHGMLHLLGYDHDTDERAEEMESLERNVLNDIGIGDPYAAQSAAEAGHGA